MQRIINKRSLIILSLAFAIIIFFVIDRASTTLVETEAEVLYNQPVTANYNDEEYVVEGLPETVDITMIGTKANLYLPLVALLPIKLLQFCKAFFFSYS